MPRYHCLIPDIHGEQVLAVPVHDGFWTLPAFEQDEEWFAFASTALARSASEHFGVAMTALHERSMGDCHVCELEIQAPQWTPPAGARWIARRDLETLAVEPAVLSDVLHAWFAERDSGTVPHIRPQWERRGWYAEAVRWILSESTRLGFVPCGPVEQLKAAWSLSTILRVNTSGGALYFKADYTKPPSEPALIEALARRWPDNVPTIVTADHARGWMLMRDFGGRSLEGEPIRFWQAANRSFSAIQVACSQDLEPWWRLGCPDLRIPALIGHMDRLFGDDSALRIGEPDGLTPSEASQLRELKPRLHDLWNALAAIPIPASIVQQDFRHENLVMSESTYLFYDWSDTVIGHPFFSCCRFLDFIQHDAHPHDGLSLEERSSRIADAYLEPWQDLLGQADLRHAFKLSRRLNPLYLAIRWYLEAPYCEPGSYWSRVLRERPINALRAFSMP